MRRATLSHPSGAVPRWQPRPGRPARARACAALLVGLLAAVDTASAQGTPKPAAPVPSTAATASPAAAPSASPDEAAPDAPPVTAPAGLPPGAESPPPPPPPGGFPPDYPPAYEPMPPPGVPPGPPPPPGFYGYEYGYGLPPPPPPEELPYEEGQPVPQGYHVGTKARRGLVIAGAVTFGALWLLSVGVAAGNVDEAEEPADWAPLFVPLAGPFISLATVDPTAQGTVALLVDGLGQGAGLAMLIAGLAARETVLVRDDLGRPRVHWSPTLVGGRAPGLGVFGAL